MISHWIVTGLLCICRACLLVLSFAVPTSFAAFVPFFATGQLALFSIQVSYLPFYMIGLFSASCSLLCSAACCHVTASGVLNMMCRTVPCCLLFAMLDLRCAKLSCCAMLHRFVPLTAACAECVVCCPLLCCAVLRCAELILLCQH